jgi:hypothetical protein
MTDETPIAYQALTKGTPVLSASGTQFGTVRHVLEIESLDLFDGIAVKTDAGLRFVDRDQVASIFSTSVHTTLSDEQAAALPAPEGNETFHEDAHEDDGPFLTDRLGRLFRREHWLKDKE